jgi:hypothetical protein
MGTVFVADRRLDTPGGLYLISSLGGSADAASASSDEAEEAPESG